MASQGELTNQAPGGLQPAAPGEVRVARALLSVSDKEGVVELARGLAEQGVEIVSTGGTLRELSRAGVEARSIEDFTGFPEIMDGRVKTLHPRLYAGLLARRDDPEHVRAATEQDIEPVDLVCVNLYPFERTLARGDASEQEVIENIDIGGPSMLRAAAKNADYVAALVDPGDYAGVLEELRSTGGRLSIATRTALAAKAFATTARYDAAISSWFATRVHAGFPPARNETYEKVTDLRYGENPHQQAAFYARAGAPTHLLSGVRQRHGKELSFNNLLDLNSARELVEELAQPACVIVKHNNPCGCALGADATEAYTRAFACDPLSAYGGVIAINRAVELDCAQRLAEQFIEVLLAPSYTDDAFALLSEKKNVRILELPDWPPQADDLDIKTVLGGQLVQTRDRVSETREQMQVISARAPDEREWQDMLFAWRVCRYVRSNAIVLARDGATVGIGAGQMSRVDAVRLAVEKARDAQPELLAGAVMASDAFFPFPDGVELGLEAGITAVIQPGGSVRDELVTAAVDAASAAMVATGVRHFRH